MGLVFRASSAMGFTAMAGFLFDHIYDLSADRVADEPTPLTPGRMSVPPAGVIAAILGSPVGVCVGWGRIVVVMTLPLRAERRPGLLRIPMAIGASAVGLVLP